MRQWKRTIMAGLILAAAACGSSSSTGPKDNGSTSTSITVRDNSFSPSATTVPVGSTVTWTWAGSAPHNVTFSDGTASSTQASGTFQHAFATAGTFAYHCTIHGAAMSGTVTVQ